MNFVTKYESIINSRYLNVNRVPYSVHRIAPVKFHLISSELPRFQNINFNEIRGKEQKTNKQNTFTLVDKCAIDSLKFNTHKFNYLFIVEAINNKKCEAKLKINLYSPSYNSKGQFLDKKI